MGPLQHGGATYGMQSRRAGRAAFRSGKGGGWGVGVGGGSGCDTHQSDGATHRTDGRASSSAPDAGELAAVHVQGALERAAALWLHAVLGIAASGVAGLGTPAAPDDAVALLLAALMSALILRRPRCAARRASERRRLVARSQPASSTSCRSVGRSVVTRAPY